MCMTELGVESKKRQVSTSKIDESEVKPDKILRKFNISTLVENIETYELQLMSCPEEDLQLSAVQTLMKLY